MDQINMLSRLINRLFITLVLTIILVLGSVAMHMAMLRGWLINDSANQKDLSILPSSGLNIPLGWQAPDIEEIKNSSDPDLINYGRELIIHTARYIGPNGKIGKFSNGMNCQNCHLQAGTKPFGNNYAKVASGYPRFRKRSGTVEGFEKRINDCIERSLNGKPLPSGSKELKAITAYFKWVGKGVKKDDPPYGSGLIIPKFLDRPADPVKGEVLYNSLCSGCHGKNGEGVKAIDGIEWSYPPLWGKNSYNKGAGLFRLSKFAGFIKSNMPYGVTFDNPILTDEQSWDIAAYVNSMPRPEKDLSDDWPDVSEKPLDHPFGPYADPYSENDHKYGPFQPIQEYKKTMQ